VLRGAAVAEPVSGRGRGWHGCWSAAVSEAANGVALNHHRAALSGSPAQCAGVGRCRQFKPGRHLIFPGVGVPATACPGRGCWSVAPASAYPANGQHENQRQSGTSNFDDKCSSWASP